MRGLVALALLAGLAASPARAEPPAQSCDVPAYLLATESALPRVDAVAKPGGKLNVLVIGSRSSSIGLSDSSAAYPHRLQAYLRDKLPGVDVNLSLELQVKKTAEEMLPLLGSLMEARKPDLVILDLGLPDGDGRAFGRDDGDRRTLTPAGPGACGAVPSIVPSGSPRHE